MRGGVDTRMGWGEGVKQLGGRGWIVWVGRR